MDCIRYPLNRCGTYRYVVILSYYQGERLLSRHRARQTWETQGGHIEPGETPAQAAARELYEESGALEYTLEPLFDYGAGTLHDLACGQVFRASIRRICPLPPSEMAEVRCFAQLPEDLTYPDITPRLFAWAEEDKKSSP